MESNGKTIAKLGAWFQIGTLLALIYTVIDLSTIAYSYPRKMEELIDMLTFLPYVGYAIGFVGIILLQIALHGKEYREIWFFNFLILFSVVTIPLFPIGTLVGGSTLVTLFTKRNEFEKKRRVETPFKREKLKPTNN